MAASSASWPCSTTSRGAPRKAKRGSRAFPCSTDPAELAQPELTVAPDVTISLPAPAIPRSDPLAARSTSGREQTLDSNGETVSELEALKQECARLRNEHRQALEAHEAETAARHESIEAEVERRIEDLRAETERERAGAQLAEQAARERDEARAARDEVAGERDEARAERDNAQRARNRMLAERDTARTRIEELTDCSSP